jgi:hypothetical protein
MFTLARQTQRDERPLGYSPRVPGCLRFGAGPLDPIDHVSPPVRHLRTSSLGTCLPAVATSFILTRLRLVTQRLPMSFTCTGGRWRWTVTWPEVAGSENKVCCVVTGTQSSGRQ